jgi:hypothetical protein
VRKLRVNVSSFKNKGIERMMLPSRGLAALLATQGVLAMLLAMLLAVLAVMLAMPQLL